MDRARYHERPAIAGVEPVGHVAGQFEVLALVVADRHLVGVVQQDVGRHEHRIGQQRQPDRFRAGRLLPELDHPGGLAVAGGALEQVVQLGVLGYVGLYVA